MTHPADWIFDPATRRICGAMGEGRLSPKAAAVLSALAETPRQVWSRDALLERVWPNVTVGEEVLTHAVAELRRAMRDDFQSSTVIETIHKTGYRLLSSVEIVDNDAASGRDGVFNLDCYAAFLEAAALFERGHKTNTRAAAEKFRAILERNPDYAPAHVGLAKAVTFLKTYYEPDGGTLEEPLLHCHAAKRIDPDLAEAYAVEGLIYAINGKFERGRRQFARALQLKPDCGDTHYLFGRACFAELDIDLAAPMLERSAALKPDDYHALMLAGKARQILGHEQLARRNFAVTIGRAAPFIAADDKRAMCADARARFQLGETDPAYIALEKAAAGHEPCYHLACTFARAGESRTALDLLEEVVDAGWNHSRWLERDPDFQGYKGHPRFERIARSIRGRPC
ncbi:MAG TPA: winged helix-turn-helix domain-containing protein [Sphingomicrobium sp.]|nr:winged helix-turn-helix domain-containing protein [Sphingomicrobium sp.]